MLEGVTSLVYSNLIRESRYLLFFRGLWVTLQITVFALMLGVAIGTVIAVLRIWKVRFFSSLAKAYVNVIRGTPAVVQLVIIYYAILANVNLSKVLVASVAFAINSGAYVSELIRAGILAVDKGQTEAARSLGLSDFRTMRFVVIPQAIKYILPALVNECVLVLKETAIAGYIALDDLTRMGDIVRSRTFDPFTPFIVVAVIYFYTTSILSLFAEKVELRMRATD
jgi:His/Glu/Gln/Arg/opine family amino acid ABC transporter permease subunit